MTNQLSPETLRIDMGEPVNRFSMKPNKYHLDRAIKAFEQIGRIGFSCEDLKKLQGR